MRQWLALLFWILPVQQVAGETGRDAWLRYAKAASPQQLPDTVHDRGTSPLLQTAGSELIRGLRGITGRILRLGAESPAIEIAVDAAFPPESYRLTDHSITGHDDKSALYGTFAYLRKLAQGEPVTGEIQSPHFTTRWVNHWDNLDGSIERGYGGRSIFWDNLKSREDLTRVAEYGRLLASLGIQATTINNVNANPKILTAEYLPHIQRIAAALRQWGVRAAISVDFGSPKENGGLDTFDPLDPKVIQYWKDAIDAVYQAVPDLAGVVLKADSEGRVGPSFYNRSHADAANVVARALAPHHGILFYRGFVYDHHMDWRNPKNDRARAAADNFVPLNGKFDDNVIVQIKNGPIDFQVREPVSPLFGSLAHTREALELQITQEYMGQARHTVFLVPQWKEVLDFRMPVQVKKLTHAIAGVSNVGMDENWFGNQMSQANLYGFGRLAWNPDLTSEQIAKEWSQLTFGLNPTVTKAVAGIQLQSWRTYEQYTGPLGLQTLTNIVGDHFGVDVEASERNGWGQWHNADKQGAGMDRTVATGTGFAGQYKPFVADMYESLSRCPDELLLFFHHVPYTHVLHSGKTVIQSLYDSHYEGAATAAAFVEQFKTLRGLIDDARYSEILTQLDYQAGSAEVWRDAVNNWFFRASGIPDTSGRVGRHDGRIEAESLTLKGYKAVQINPWEAASGGTAITCQEKLCSAALRHAGPAGWYQLRIQYFDMPAGAARFRVTVAGKLVEEWTADDHLPARRLDASAGKRHIIETLALRPGDEILIEGIPDGKDPAALDFVEFRLTQ